MGRAKSPEVVTIQSAPMDDKEFGERLRRGVGSPELWRLRRKTAIAVGRGFHSVGLMLSAAVDQTNPDHRQIVAFSMLRRNDYFYDPCPDSGAGGLCAHEGTSTATRHSHTSSGKRSVMQTNRNLE